MRARARLLPHLLGLALGASAFACANEAPTVMDGGERAKTFAVVTVDRSDPASPDVPGSASAIARFVSVPAFFDTTRLLVAAGAALDLPAPGTCRTGAAESQQQEDLEGALTLQGPVEFVEAGEVTLAASGVATPLVPHAFPAVGNFASGVLYTTRDRDSALPSAAPYLVSVSGSTATPSLHTEADAPGAPANVQIGRVDLGEVDGLRTDRSIVLSWDRGSSADVVYLELLAYDGAPTLVCTFHDDAGMGMVPPAAFSGAGNGRVALHRLRTRQLGAPTAPTGEIRFDFQVGTAVEFSR